MTADDRTAQRNKPVPERIRLVKPFLAMEILEKDQQMEAQGSSQVIVTAGNSPAMLLAFSVLLERGHKMIMPDPYYACSAENLPEGMARLKKFFAALEK